MNDYLTTALTYGSVLGLTGTLAPLASLVSLKNPRAADPVIRLYCRAILGAAGVRVGVEGLENLPAKGQFILVSNHQSHFDALVIMSVIERHLRFVAKTELYRIPIFGQALRLTGNLEVDRSGSERDREVLRAAADAVRERVSIVFFAEGTRSEDGVLKSFKRGAALLALLAQVPIVPFAVAGTKDILPKGGRWVQGRQPVAVRIGPPIPTQGLGADQRDRLTERAREQVVSLLGEAEAALTAPR